MSVESNRKNKSGNAGGLSNLMEAATALSQLVGSSSPTVAVGTAAEANIVPPPDHQQHQSVISDDDESCQKSKGTFSTSNLVKQQQTGSMSTNNINKQIFPQRLMDILNDTSLSDIITWLPNGKSFVIVRPDVFTAEVLPKYLPPVDARGSTKYPSFTRKLNRWGFRQITRGPDTGAFHHALFQRDQPDLCLQMVCQRSRDRRSNDNKHDLPKNKRLNLPTTAVGGAHPSNPAMAPSSISAVSLDSMQSSISGASSIATSTMNRGQNVVSGFLNVPTGNGTPATAAGSGPATMAVNTTISGVHPAVVGAVSKDESLIRQALKRSQEQERLRVAKAMLYHAYMQALGAASQQQQHAS